MEEIQIHFLEETPEEPGNGSLCGISDTYNLDNSFNLGSVFININNIANCYLHNVNE